MGIAVERYKRLFKKRNKFGAIRVKADGINFDSKAEYRRYQQLRFLEDHGDIKDLVVHPKFPFNIRHPRLEMSLTIWSWKADFYYREGDERIVEDVKGGKATLTTDSRRSHILFRFLYPDYELRIVEL